MSSFDRRSLLISLTALAACGYTPVYGPGGEAEGLRGRITIDPPRDSEGFELVRRLEDRLGAVGSDYRLSAAIRTGEESLGITPEQVITRFSILGEADYRLTDAATGTLVASGTVSGFTSYSATGTPVATRAARRDATRRLMVILADRIVAELLATAGDWMT
jgi:LPS-assembly lipoprotein